MALETYDVVVAGLGVVGSSVVHAAARRGLSVCGLEQFEPGHVNGSSHGESRIIRKAYFLHPDYIPLLERAYRLWRELETDLGENLMVLNGLICVGEPEGALIKGLERSYSRHALPHERMSAQEAMKRWPQYHLPPEAAVYFDPEGGFLRADRCLAGLQSKAQEKGATLHFNESLVDWKSSDAIRTTQRTISAKHLIVTNGSWMVPELARLGIELQILRKALFWYTLKQPENFRSKAFPAFICQFGGHDIYGFPTLDGSTMKAAEDTGGQRIEDPTKVERGYLPEDEAALRSLLEEMFPGQLLDRCSTKTCLYTVTADRNFVLGNHPDLAGVTLGSCCSGHGFKLGPAMGEVLLEMALSGSVPAEAKFLAPAVSVVETTE